MVMVSVIIPVYNAEMYIAECLDSLIHQTYSALEIICVDDGSTDGTYSILETYRLKESRIKLFRQDNQYAGAARNKGIGAAEGKYLLFVDADDFCREDMVEKLVNKAESESTNILIFDLNLYDDKAKKIVQDSWKSVYPSYFGEGVKSAVDLKDTIFQVAHSGPMNKLFLREFVVKNNIWFQQIPRTNDLFFVYVAMTYAERIAILDEKLEYYRINNLGSLQSTNDRSPFSFFTALQGLKDNLVHRGVYSLFQKSYEKMALSVSMVNLASIKDKDIYIKLMNTVSNRLTEFGIGIYNTKCNAFAGDFFMKLRQALGIVIYGAGMCAEVLVKYLLFVKRVDTTKIKIVVTKKSGAKDDLCGIKIAELKDLSDGCIPKTGMFVVAVDDKNVQRTMIKNLCEAGIEDAMPVGYPEMAVLIGHMKILIFGTGEYYRRYKKWFVNSDILALLDNSEQKQNTYIDGLKVLSPKDGIKLNYDIIVILSFYVGQMKKQLIDLGVEERHIYHFYSLHKLIDFNSLKRPLQSFPNAEEIIKIKQTAEPKILLMSHDLTLGGPAIALYHAAEVLKKRGFSVVYASMIDGPLRETLIKNEIPVIIDENLQIATMLETDWVNTFSIIICNTLNFHVFLSERDTRIPIIWWLHDARFFYDGVDRDVIGRIDLHNLTAVSVGPIPADAVKEFLPDMQYGMLLYGVEDFSGKKKKPDSSKIRFITIGFLEMRKGQDILLDAVWNLPDTVKDRCEFYIVGHGDTMFGERMHGEGMDMSSIVFTGSVGREKIHELLNSSDILICPSRQDPMPTVVAEAMMHGVPCIMSDATGTAAYIHDSTDGFIFPSGDAQVLADKIKWCAENREKLSGIGQKARKVYEKIFSMVVFEKQFMELIENVLEQ